MYVGVPYFSIAFVICFALAAVCFFLQRRIPGRPGLFHFQVYYWLLGFQYFTLVFHQYYVYKFVDLITDLTLAMSHYFLVVGAVRHAGYKTSGMWMLFPAASVFILDQFAPPSLVYPAFLYASGCLLLASLALLSRASSNWGENAMAYTFAFWAALALAFGIFAMQDLTELQAQRFVYAYAFIPPVVAISGLFLVTSHLLDVQKIVEQDAYRSVFENTNIAIVQTDEQGKVLLANSAAQGLLHLEDSDALLQTMVELETPLRNNPQRIVRTLVKQADASVPVEIHWAVVRDRIQWQFRDLSHDELIQKRERESVKAEAMGLLAGAVSHDLRNVFSAVAYISEYIRSSFQQSGQGHLLDAVDGFDQALKHGQSLLDRLSGISSSSQNEKIAPVDLTDVVRLVVKSYESSHRSFEIEQRVELEPAIALGNSDLLIRILFNLCENSISAIQDLEDGLVLLILTRSTDGEKVVLTVRDNGSGMSEEVQARIFEPYFSTKKDGTGLGLFSVQQMVEEMKGEVRVQSLQGQGTEFQILLPIANESESETAAVDRLPVGIRVLVVDDDELSCRMLATMLEKFGCATERANSPLDAIKLLKKNTFDFMVTDFVMEPMDGVDLTLEARRLQPKLRVVLVTGYGDILLEQPRLVTGDFVCVLTKPFPSHALINALTGKSEKTRDGKIAQQ